MTNVLILYYSKGGSTKSIAMKIAQGVALAGANPIVKTVPEIMAINEETNSSTKHNKEDFVTKADIEGCDAIILGSPTRFGNMAAPLKYFLDSTSDLWFQGALINKPAAVFTSASTMHGAQEATLFTMMLPLIHHGAILVGIPYSESAMQQTTTGGTPYGMSHYDGVNSNLVLSKDEVTLSKFLGKRVAEIAIKMDK